MPRLFTGIEIPDEVREEIARLQGAAARRPLDRAREPAPDAALLSATSRKRRRASSPTGSAAIRVDAFEMRLAGLGMFGGNEPRSIWAGVEPRRARGVGAGERARGARLAGCRRRHDPSNRTSRWRGSSTPSPDQVARVLRPDRRLPLASRFSLARFVLFSAKPKVGGGPYVVEEAFPLRGGEFADYRRPRRRVVAARPQSWSQPQRGARLAPVAAPSWAALGDGLGRSRRRSARGRGPRP